MRKKSEFCGWTPGEPDKLDQRHREVVKIFSAHQLERILDVGCGDGRFSRLLANVSQAKEVYGLEISEQGVEIAEKLRVKAIQMDIDCGSFPFGESFFDAIFCGEIIEHLYDPDHLLEEVHRVLKPHGLLVLSTPNLAWWLNRIALLLGFYPFGLNPSLRHPLGHLRELSLTQSRIPVFADHFRVFTLPALLKLLSLHGFDVHEVKGIGGQIPFSIPLSKLFNAVDKVLSVVPSFSFRCVVLAFKECEGRNADKQS